MIEKEATSLTQTILAESMKITKFAMLSRAMSGIRKKTLIINLPGSRKGSQVNNHNNLLMGIFLTNLNCTIGSI